MTLSALPTLEYDLLVYRWSLGRLYVWLLAKHVEQFNREIQKMVADFRPSISRN